VLLWILLLAVQIRTEPGQSPGAILDRVGLDIRRNEPSWQLVRPICSLPPLMDEQEDFSCGNIQVGSGVPIRIVASVSMHQIISPSVVSRWMSRVPSQSPAGWVVVPYDLGVPAYLSTLQNPPSVGITFGKGRFVVAVNGTSKMDVERVARSVLRQMAD